MWKRVFSFIFRFALASIVETSIVAIGLDPFVFGYDRSNDPFWTPLFGARRAAHPVIPNRSGLSDDLVVEIFAFGTVASSVHLATC